ncbi:hypothetical protein Q4511_06095 [Paracoccus sp. 1_MG-2023]|uniref:hypothetical protein n=1 Tax=unclassified Paracoccus (in: a-proteobacteria) TaxID=2688777 RepID=UPI001C0940A9|nr:MULTISPECIES: hypothetical protein [unclassified Paracoccus (in: a-proteobacteria)]MBU2958526.1 hypothetical protein [Paracoccus sp. C2R09]MDO6668489.1 hypothetical protein [Paracoccus sp. 1_MG-2023]
MQLIVRYSIQDYTGFRTAFDADTEDRGNAGLSLLQLWTEDAGHAWALFEVNDAKAARDWLSGAAAVFASQAGVTATDAHFLETA